MNSEWGGQELQICFHGQYPVQSAPVFLDLTLQAVLLYLRFPRRANHMWEKAEATFFSCCLEGGEAESRRILQRINPANQSNLLYLALHHCSAGGCVRTAKALLIYHSTFPLEDGNTPLHVASR